MSRPDADQEAGLLRFFAGMAFGVLLTLIVQWLAGG